MKHLITFLLGMVLLFPALQAQSLTAEQQQELKAMDKALTEVLATAQIHPPGTKDTLIHPSQVDLMTYEYPIPTGRYVASIIPEGVLAQIKDGEEIVNKYLVTIWGEDKEGNQVAIVKIFLAELRNTKLKFL